MKVLPLIAVLILQAASALAGPREELKIVVEQVRKTPSDQALRTKAIVIAKKLKPSVPEDARRAMIRGNTAFTAAKDRAGFARAIERFEEATTLAPWWAEPYFNLAKACEAAKDYDRALTALGHYRAAAATEADKRQGQDLAYAVEELRDLQKAEMKSASDAAAAEASAAAAQARAESSIEGAWYQPNDNGVFNYPAPPDVLVTRIGNSFEVKALNYLGATVTDIRADETTLRFVSHTGIAANTYDLHREGEFLVGPKSTAMNGQYWNYQSRMVRKPWPLKSAP